jgi:hypothetical protein
VSIPPSSRWTAPTACEGLILFAQRVEDLLSDFTLDSYRAPALNTHYRCRELLDAIREVERKALHPRSLEPMGAELARSITDDTAARARLGARAAEFMVGAFWTGHGLEELRTRVAYALARLERVAYEDELIAQLRVLLPSAREKRVIQDLTANLVVSWLNAGHPAGSIYYHCRRYFFRRRGPKILSCDALDGFVALLRRPETRWTVLFRAAPALFDLRDAVPKSIAVADMPPDIAGSRHDVARFTSAARPATWITMQVEATDALSARQDAERLLWYLVNRAQLYAHRGRYRWQTQALVTGDSGNPTLVRSPTSSAWKLPDVSPTELPRRLAETSDALTRMEPDSQVRFRRASNLHGTAVRSEIAENQLLSLWAALETLLPIDTVESRIGAVVDLMVPALSRHYVAKLLTDIDAALERNGVVAYREAKSAIDIPLSPIHKCAALLALEANRGALTKVFAAITVNPLLRHRVFALATDLATAQSIRAMIERHSERVGWQIHRIYRGRNFIMHSGRSMPYLNTVVENLHTYLDTVLDQLIRILGGPESPQTIAGALLQIRLEHSAHMELLKRSHSDPCTEETFSDLIFGPGGQLEPS